MIIYKITNLINQKIYIGLTTCTLKERWQNHKGCVKNRMKKIKNLIHNDIHYIKDTMRIKNKNDLPANIFSVILITVFSVGYGLFITVIILRYIL